MANFTITIDNLDIINNLITAINYLTLEIQRFNHERKAVGAQNEQVTQQPTVFSQQPAQQETPTAEIQQSTIPTSHVAQDYTIEQLQKVMAHMMDSGHVSTLRGIMQQFGVQSIMDLPKEKYGAMATALREAGAQI